MIRFLSFIIVLGCSLSVINANDGPFVGAIRWDAWTGGKITDQVERTLAPSKYHHRLPWFAEVKEDAVNINGNDQTIMDREIDFAQTSGLDYWAFLVYDKNNSMSVALDLYLKSKKNDSVKFCLILYNTLESSERVWPRERQRAIELLKKTNYQNVLDDRPLVYFFIKKGFPFERFKDFKNEAIKQGLNPYCVAMDWSAARNFKKFKEQGFDAASAYAYGSNHQTYDQLTKAVETSYWSNAKKNKVPYIPFVTTGWDKQPRIDNPVSWEKDSKYHTQKTFPSIAESHEISKHLSKAIKFTKENETICESQAVIIYAWNEFDEGGWLCPTYLGEGKANTSRLDALKDVLVD